MSWSCHHTRDLRRERGCGKAKSLGKPVPVPVPVPAGGRGAGSAGSRATGMRPGLPRCARTSHWGRFIRCQGFISKLSGGELWERRRDLLPSPSPSSIFSISRRRHCSLVSHHWAGLILPATPVVGPKGWALWLWNRLLLSVFCLKTHALSRRRSTAGSRVTFWSHRPSDAAEQPRIPARDRAGVQPLCRSTAGSPATDPTPKSSHLPRHLSCYSELISPKEETVAKLKNQVNKMVLTMAGEVSCSTAVAFTSLQTLTSMLGSFCSKWFNVIYKRQVNEQNIIWDFLLSKAYVLI